MTLSEQRAPKILTLGWGVMEVEDLGRGKDFKLWPGGGRPWDWSETGTHHRPGIQKTDVEELLAHGARHVVLSRGQLCQLQTHSQPGEDHDTHGLAYHQTEYDSQAHRTKDIDTPFGAEELHPSIGQRENGQNQERGPGVKVALQAPGRRLHPFSDPFQHTGGGLPLHTDVLLPLIRQLKTAEQSRRLGKQGD